MSTHPPAEGQPPSPHIPTDTPPEPSPGSCSPPGRDVAPAGLGFLLGAAHRARRRVWEATLVDLDLTAPEAAALRAITAHPGIGLRQLSRALVTDVMNARRLSVSLIQAGLCENRPDPQDARRRPLHPTPAGQTLALVVADRAVGSEQELRQLLGGDTYAAVLSGLRRLADHDPPLTTPGSLRAGAHPPDNPPEETP
jgi:DNA-binding MarR family transcriptional regulator